MLSHPLAVSVILGALSTVLFGGLMFSRIGHHWPLAMALCAPGALVFGWLMVRELSKAVASGPRCK